MSRRLAALVAIAVAMAPAAARAQAPLVDAEGRAIEAADATRTVTVGGAVTEIVYRLGMQGKLVAVDTTSQYPPEALKALPNVGYMRALSAEGVLSLRPTLILADADSGPPAALAQLRAAGARLVVLKRDLTPLGVVYKIRAVARVLGRGAEGEAIAAAYATDMDELAAAVAKIERRPRVLFILSAARGSAMAAGQETLADLMIQLAGGVNAIQGYTGYKPLSGEAVIAGKPEVVLTTTSALQAVGGVDELLARPELAATPAGRDKRVVTLNSLLLLGFGPRTPFAVHELVSKLHPGAALPVLKSAASAP